MSKVERRNAPLENDLLGKCNILLFLKVVYAVKNWLLELDM